MGIVHHSNYVRYYEAARMEFFRQIDLPYKSIEKQEFILPVVDVKIHYSMPAFYDDLLTIKTELHRVAGPRLIFQHKIYNLDRQLINEGETALAFVAEKTRKAVHPPQWFIEAITKAEALLNDSGS